MKQFIKDFIFFIVSSKDFTGYSYLRMILKEHGIKRGIWFAKQMNYDRKMKSKYGSEGYYAMMNRTIEI